MEVLGGWHTQRWKIHTLSYASLPPRCSSVSFIIFFYNKLVNVSKLFPWILWATLANWLNLKRGSWELLIYSWLVRSTGDKLHLQLACEGGEWSCGAELLTCGIWCHLQVHSVRINCRMPSWSCRELLGLRKTPTCMVSEVWWVW